MIRRILAAALLIGLVSPARAGADDDALFAPSRLRIGVGDRLELWQAGDGRRLRDVAGAQGLPLDYLQLWLTRGWSDSWVEPEHLRELNAHGVVPVVVHYWFGDAISRERVESQRKAWYTSLWRLSQRIRKTGPVLVVLEPEFNVDPPKGETAVLDWPGFAEDLRAAAAMIRREAPNARVGVCAGDFQGPPRLESVLGPVADDLDFLAFQEMRASTDPAAKRAGYGRVGRAALAYAYYLRRAFGRPLLLAYVAVSSHGGWESRQARALADLARHESALRAAGVFGAIYLQLVDDPDHEGYFGAAEKHFGLMRRDGTPKPALQVLRSLSLRGRPAAPAR